MNLVLYNTLTRAKEAFVSQGEYVGLYGCGPSLRKSHTHIGSLRSYVFADLIKRYLSYRGLQVRHVTKLTDVNDQIIEEVQQTGQSLRDYTDLHLRDYLQQLRDLNVIVPDALPRVTDHIHEIVEAIRILEAKGFAYRVGSTSIYFDVSKSPNYGKLALLDRLEKRDNAQGRLDLEDQDEKRSVNDFCLWKAWKPKDGEIYWETDIGKGRPSWHIGCSVLSMKYLGETVDIHVGGISHIFPHHTNEIAQSEAITGKTFVRYWVHHDFLVANGRSMSRQKTNRYTLNDIKQAGYDPILLRIVLLQMHYQRKLDFDFDKFDEAARLARRFMDFLVSIDLVSNETPNTLDIDELIDRSRSGFNAGMDMNLNISMAIASVLDLIRKVNNVADTINVRQAAKIREYIMEVDSVLGFIDLLYSRYQHKLQMLLDDSSVQELLARRDEMLSIRDYQQSDIVRAALNQKGIVIRDGANGPKVRLADTLITRV